MKNVSKTLSPQDPMYQQIQQTFDMEIARKTPRAVLTFIGTAMVFFFTIDLNNDFDPVIKALCFLMIILSCYRIYICRKSVAVGKVDKAARRKIHLNVYMTTTVWAIMFSLSSFFFGFKDAHTVLWMGAFFALGGGAPFTLSYEKSLLLYLTFSWNIPQYLILAYHYFTGRLDTTSFISFVCYFTFFTAYLVKQGLAYRDDLIAKEVSEIELKKTTEELIESRQKIIEQTAMTIHSNRLSAIGEMAAGIAHEINTPLAIIQLRADGLLSMSKSGEANGESFAQEIGMIQAVVSRIAKIILGLRAFARDSAGDNKEPAKVDSMVNDALDLCQEKFKNNKIELIVAEQCVKNVECVPVQIVQVMVNLLNNAFDAVKGSQRPWVRIRSFSVDDKVIIEVVDSGLGIPAEIQGKIMQPFFTTKEVGSGTGLGLSVSKGIVESHKGVLRYQEAEGHTGFQIELPAHVKV